MGLQIFGNLDRNTVTAGLVISGTNLNAKVAPNFVAGDNIAVDIFLTSNDGIQDIQTYTAQRLAIGPINAKPTGGTYKIDYGGTSNVTLNFDATAQDFADAINTNAPSVPSPVTGTQIAPFTYVIDFGSNGTCTLPTIDSDELTPSSAVNVQRLITGDSSTKEKWLVRLFQNPIAFINSGFTNFTDSNNNKGIRGSLNLATEGVYDLLDANESALSTIELELTDSNGNVQTIFQTPITILADVIGLGSSASSGLPSAIPTSAVTFLNSFPNPTFVGNVTFSGSTEFQNDITVTNGGIELQDTGLDVTGGGDVVISGGGNLQVGSFEVDSADGTITSDVTFGGDITGEANFDGEVKFEDEVTFEGGITGVATADIEGLSSALALKADLSSPTFTGTSTFSKITTGEIQCLVTAPGLPADASPINYDASEHRFRDYDEDPTNLMVIKKINYKSGARVGVNIPAGQDPKCAFHVNYGGSSDGLPREALRVTGGAMFNEWVRIGHFTDTERDALTTPTNGTIIYNDQHHEFQAYIGGGQGNLSQWRKISTEAVST